MLHLSLMLSNPFAKHSFDNLFCKAFSLSENKTLETELTYQGNGLFEFSFSLTFRQDHAGIQLSVGLFGLAVSAHVYDNRHWNTELDDWE